MIGFRGACEPGDDFRELSARWYNNGRQRAESSHLTERALLKR
jgi:hypothetical protein